MVSFSLKWCIAIDKAEIHLLVIHGILWLSFMIDNMKCSINMLRPEKMTDMMTYLGVIYGKSFVLWFVEICSFPVQSTAIVQVIAPPFLT